MKLSDIRQSDANIPNNLIREPTKKDLLNMANNDFMEDYVMPTLPMKFSFNKIYIAPTETKASVDYSLKAIFSKNANVLQLQARYLFLKKLGILFVVGLLLFVGIIVLAVLLGSKKDQNTAISTSTILTTIIPQLSVM